MNGLPRGITGLPSDAFDPAVIDAVSIETIDHPLHYGGADNLYEAIKVIEAWRLGFHLGNTLKYIARAGKKDGKTSSQIEDLKKARWYLDRKIASLEDNKDHHGNRHQNQQWR